MSKLSIKSIIKFMSKRPTSTKTKKMKYFENTNISTRNDIHDKYYAAKAEAEAKAKDKNKDKDDDPLKDVKGSLPTTMKNLTQQVKDYGKLIDQKLELATKVKKIYEKLKKSEKAKNKINQSLAKNVETGNELTKKDFDDFIKPFKNATDKLETLKNREATSREYVKALAEELGKAKRFREYTSALRKNLESAQIFVNRINNIEEAQIQNKGAELNMILLAVKKLSNLKSKLNMDMLVYNKALESTQKKKISTSIPYSQDKNDQFDNIATSDSLENNINIAIKKIDENTELVTKLNKISAEEEILNQSVEASFNKFNEINLRILEDKKNWLSVEDFKNYLSIVHSIIFAQRELST